MKTQAEKEEAEAELARIAFQNQENERLKAQADLAAAIAANEEA